MGVTEKAISDAAHDAALRAFTTGRELYAPTLGKPSAFAPADKWALELDAIEAAGWHLEQWTVDGGAAYPVFRRVVDTTVTNH